MKPTDEGHGLTESNVLTAHEIPDEDGLSGAAGGASGSIPGASGPAESVGGEAGGEAVMLWKCEGCGHWVDAIFVKAPDDPEQTACPVCAAPDLPDEPSLATFVPESSLNAALAERDRLAEANRNRANQISRLGGARDAALARAEEAERERDEWQRKAGLNRADYLRVEEERDKLEGDRDKLEALAAGQAATIERVRKWAEGGLNRTREEAAELESVKDENALGGSFHQSALYRILIYRNLLFLLNPKESEDG